MRRRGLQSFETPQCQLRAEACGGTCSLPFPRGTCAQPLLGHQWGLLALALGGSGQSANKACVCPAGLCRHDVSGHRAAGHGRARRSCGGQRWGAGPRLGAAPCAASTPCKLGPDTFAGAWGGAAGSCSLRLPCLHNRDCGGRRELRGAPPPVQRPPALGTPWQSGASHRGAAFLVLRQLPGI